MINRSQISRYSLIAVIAMNLLFSNIATQTTKAQEVTSINQVNPIELVSNPQTYLNKKIKISATFDKFSTLGLDYQPAFRDSKKYISFLIRRTDVSGDYNIPLSELKLILPRDKAEKLIDMESGDQIEFTGQVFSSALNDPWVDVDNVKIISSKIKNASNKTELDKTSNKQLLNNAVNKKPVKPVTPVKKPANKKPVKK